MGYQENYVIDNEDFEVEKPVVTKTAEPVRINKNTRYEESEAIQPVDMEADVIQEIHDTAVAEGLVAEHEGPFGGEGTPSPEDVISDFIGQERPEAVEEKIEEYTDKKVEKTKKVMATREILTGMAKRLINVTVPVVIDIQQPDGSIKPELVDMDLKVRRLTESQINHLYNRRMVGKTVNEMTNEELDEDNHFRCKFLSETVVDPQMDFDTWYNEVPGIATGTIFNAVQDALSSIDDASLFQ